MVYTTEKFSARQLLVINVLRLRGERGWSQEQLALQGGFHRTFITQVERQVRNVSLDNLEKLANALGVEMGDLFIRPK